MEPYYQKNTKKHQKSSIKETKGQPPGLEVGKIKDQTLLKLGLKEAEQIFNTDCKGQIALNQKFFLNLPFPLNCSREANTPVLSLEDEKIKSLCALFGMAMENFDVDKEALPRANIIVREYNPGQSISFHTDELECDSQVVGLILLNENPDHKGLCFQRGENKFQLNYTLEETSGTIFVMSHEARYKWKHGLPPVSARRISVTGRFYRKPVYQAYIKNMTGEDIDPEPPAEEPQRTGKEKVRVVFHKNTDWGHKRPAQVSECADIKELKTVAKNKLMVKSKVQQIYLEDGNEVLAGYILHEDQKLFVTYGEKFVGRDPTKEPKKPPPPADENKEPIFGNAFIQSQYDWWSNYRFCNIRFTVNQSSDPNNFPGRIAVDTIELEELVAKSYLSIPEIRDLILKLRELVEDLTNGFTWGFDTSKTATARITSIFVIHSTQGWIQFTAQAKPSVKGDKKKDGPLWTLEGGHNNPNEKLNIKNHTT